MNPTKWNPFRELEEVLDKYQRRSNLPTHKGSGHELMASVDWSPSVDISETDQEYLIKVEIPEVEKDDVKVTVDKGILTIQGERKIEKTSEDKKHHRIERYYGSFARSFSLPENTQQEEIRAEHKNGMLYMHLPKTQTQNSNSREININ